MSDDLVDQTIYWVSPYDSTAMPIIESLSHKDMNQMQDLLREHFKHYELQVNQS